MASPSKPSNRSTSGPATVNKKVAKAARAGGGPSKRQRKADSFSLGVIGVCVAGAALVAGSVYGKRVLEAAPYIGPRPVENGDPIFASKRMRNAAAELKKLQAATKPDTKKIEAAQKKYNDLVSDSHWHSAYAIWNCDKWEPAIDGTTFADPAGIHAHDDGLMHIHPFLSRAAGKKAKTKLFFDSVYVSMNKSELKFPDPSGTPVSDGSSTVRPTKFTTLKTSAGCKDAKGKKQEAQVLLYKWDSTTDTTAEIYESDFGSVPLVESGAYALVFAPKDLKRSSIKMPATAQALANPSDLNTTPEPTSDSPVTAETPTTATPTTSATGSSKPTESTKATGSTVKGSTVSTEVEVATTAAPTTKAS